MIDLHVQIKKSGGNCFDDVMETVSGWYNRSCRMMHADGLKFAFHPASPEMPTIGARMQVDFQTVFPLMETFHGLRMRMHQHISPEEAFSLIKGQLEAGNPVILAQDDYYNPGDPNFGVRHATHHLMIVTGCEPDTKGLYCIDPFFERGRSLLPYDLFAQGFDRCITCTPVATKAADGVFMKAALRDIVKEELRGKSAAAMLALAEALPAIRMEDETKGCATFGDSLLFLRHAALNTSRRNYSHMLRYLAVHADSPSLYGTADVFELLANRWMIIIGHLTKLNNLAKQEEGGTASQETVIRGLMAKIAEASEAEIEALEILHNQLGHDERAFNQREVAAAVHHEEVAVKEIVPVDLVPYFHTRAIENDAGTANFDSEGYYFSREGAPEGTLRVADMLFAFPALALDDRDNLVCQGQAIDLPDGEFQGLMLLGCCEFGSYRESLTVEFADGSSEDLPFGFSDWWTYTPVDGEIIAWRSNVMRLGKGKQAAETYMYAKKKSFRTRNTPVRLHLPDLSTIHIFGISLWK
ncbi:BtrH N-terminal domain-containing protein [Xylanibacillus composti]|nr:BtrH N-terminal domain-containing protein [Xylanibacillus composti]